MRYAVTGAGMLGGAIASSLRADGHDVVLIDVVDGPGITHADLMDQAALRSAIDGVEGVFHTAALHGFRDAADTDYFDVNVAGTWRLLGAMAEAGVRRLVHSSTIGVYGEGPRVVVGPDSSPAPGTSPYNESKRLAEEIVRYFGARHRMDVVCLRYGAFRELLDRVFGTVPQEWAMSGAVVALDDLVIATRSAMDRLPLPRLGYVVAPTSSGSTYSVDASATESDLGVRLRRLGS